MKQKLLYIKWHDSCGVTSKWEYINEAELENKAVIVESVGYIIAEDKKAITIVGNITNRTNGDEIEVCGAMTIPKGCIIKRKVLKI